MFLRKVYSLTVMPVNSIESGKMKMDDEYCGQFETG